jgi:hypothetical protein
MPVKLIEEQELRASLRPFRVDRAAFERVVRQRIEERRRNRDNDPLTGLPSWLRTAAALLPLPEVAKAVAPGGAAGIGSKLVGAALFPAISLFVVLGAAVLSAVKVRQIGQRSGPASLDAQAFPEAVRAWWHSHRWGAYSVFAISLGLALLGVTWLLYLFYVVSLGLLVYVIASLSKAGLGNRSMVATSSLMALMFLGQMAIFSGIGDSEIHFVDQNLVAVVFFVGVLLLLPFAANNLAAEKPMANPRPIAALSLLIALLLGLATWVAGPIIRPATPTRVKAYVESFDTAPFSSVSWRQWEIPARWAIDAGLQPNLTRPRRLFDLERSGEQNRFVLGSAFRAGLVTPSDLRKLRDYESRRKSLFSAQHLDLAPQQLPSLAQTGWVIRAAVMAGDLTDSDRDYLAQRLHATFDALAETGDALELALRVTQLLEVIDRPAAPAEYRQHVHEMLLDLHCTRGGGFQLAGGFKQYDVSRTSDLEASAYAVELMDIYGVPSDLDLNWVRSYLKPIALRFGNQRWIAAVSRDRLQRLPGVTPPGWLEILYYERSLLAAVALVGLCLCATFASPRPSRAKLQGQSATDSSARQTTV